MHVGKTDENGKKIKSKTEAMYFPANVPQSKEELTPDLIEFGQGEHVHYTDKFKYLGSKLVPTLDDDIDIQDRIHQATAQVASLENFWRSNVDLQTKRSIFLSSLPVNAVL